MSMQIVLFRLQKSRWEGYSSLSVEPAYFQNIRRVLPWCLTKQRDEIPARNVTTRAPRVRRFRRRFLDPLHPYASTMRHNVAPLWRANWNLKARYASYKTICLPNFVV